MPHLRHTVDHLITALMLTGTTLLVELTADALRAPLADVPQDARRATATRWLADLRAGVLAAGGSFPLSLAHQALAQICPDPLDLVLSMRPVVDPRWN